MSNEQKPGLVPLDEYGWAYVDGLPRYDVFISYSHRDRDWVKTFAEDLRAHGLDVFVDYEAILPGDKARVILDRSLQESIYILYIVTAHSVDSSWVPYEISYFWDNVHLLNQRRLIPILLEECELGRNLRELTAVSFKDKERYKESLAYLANHLVRLHGLHIGPVRIHQLSEANKSINVITERIGRRVACPSGAIETLELAAYELIRNAFDHASSENARVFVEVEASERKLVLRVQDSGKGFDLAHQLRVQQEAIQADPLAKRGRGLLSLLDKAVLKNVIAQESHSVICEITPPFPFLVHVEGAEAASRQKAHFAYYFVNEIRTICLRVNLTRLTLDFWGEFSQSMVVCSSFEVDWILVDVSRITYVDSAGMSMLVSGLTTAQRRGLRFALLSPSKKLSDAMKINKLENAIDIFHSIADAKAALASKSEDQAG